MSDGVLMKPFAVKLSSGNIATRRVIRRALEAELLPDTRRLLEALRSPSPQLSGDLAQLGDA